MAFSKRELNVLGVSLLVLAIFMGGVYAGTLVPSNPVNVHVSATGISLAVNTDLGFVGDVFTFTGVTSVDGVAIEGIPISLSCNGVEVDTTTSGIGGSFTLYWTATEAGDFTFIAYATFA